MFSSDLQAVLHLGHLLLVGLEPLRLRVHLVLVHVAQVLHAVGVLLLHLLAEGQHVLKLRAWKRKQGESDVSAVGHILYAKFDRENYVCVRCFCQLEALLLTESGI